MKTSHSIAWFWFHIEWDNAGNGIDQHGRKWKNPDNPKLVHGHEIVKSICESTKDIIEAVLKCYRNKN